MVSYAEIVQFKAVPVPTMQPVLHWGSGRPMPTEAENDEACYAFWNVVERESEVRKRRNRLWKLKFKEAERGRDEHFPMPKAASCPIVKKRGKKEE